MDNMGSQGKRRQNHNYSTTGLESTSLHIRKRRRTDCGEFGMLCSRSRVYGGDHSCSVCLEEISPMESSRLVGCKHEFHHSCILEWTRISTFCPLCRSRFSQISHCAGVSDVTSLERCPNLEEICARNSTETLRSMQIMHFECLLFESQMRALEFDSRILNSAIASFLKIARGESKEAAI